jgi:hypothetical protein
MYAVEFEAQVHNHVIRVPDDIPEGMEMRVLLLLKDTQSKREAMPSATDTPDLKQLLMSLTEGLTDEDLARPLDIGRDIAL